jgi:ubiquinone/menaquinone biosynthesis C-methylase UbiE
MTEGAGTFSRRIRNYYSEQGVKEWKRLVQDPYHQVEFITTMHFLKKYLPKRGHILDAGGGPGRYTVALAKRGYDVTLLDFTPKQLEIARRQIRKEKVGRRVKQIIEASITDLSEFEDGKFDAVLCLGGPMSHLILESDRKKAAKELVRVAKKGAPVFVSAISKLGLLVTELLLFPHQIDTAMFRKIRDRGDYLGRGGFTTAHFFLPEELKDLFKEKANIVDLVSLEGLGSGNQEEVNRLKRNRKRWDAWMETHLMTCTEPSQIGRAEHMLLVGKKK